MDGEQPFKLIPAKTEIIWFGSARKLKHCPMDELSIAGVMLRPSSQVPDLCVQVDSNLSMLTHINHLFCPPETINAWIRLWLNSSPFEIPLKFKI